MTSQMNMAASLYFMDNNNLRTKYAEYRVMTMNGVMNLTYHTPMPMGNMPAAVLATPPANLQPTVYQVKYFLANNTMSATCFQNGSTNNATAVSCMQGSYTPDQLSLTLTDTRTNAVSRLQSTQPAWYWGNSEPSFLLKDVQPDGQLGEKTVVETVSGRASCTTVKLCLSRGSDLDMMATLGLALGKHSSGDMVACVSNTNNAD